VRIECDVTRGKGTRRIRLTLNAIQDGRAVTRRCSYIGEDVTDRAADAARQRLLEAAVEAVSDGIVITDAQLQAPGPRIVYVNDAFSALTGYTRQELVGKTPRILQGIDTDRAVIERLRQELDQEQTFVGETVNYRKDGTSYLTSWTIAPLRDEEGGVTHWVSAQRDVTARRELERQVLEVQEAEQARIARDLHDTVAQQLTVLNLILANARIDLASTSAATPEQLRQLRDAADQAKAAADQARALSHSLNPLQIGDSGLGSALDQLAARAQLAYGIECDVVRDGFDDAALPANVATQLFRVAGEAVNNAMRHAEARRVVIELQVLADTADGLRGVMSVIDDGVGLPDLPTDHERGRPGRSRGIGLDSMRYRAQIIAGRLSIVPASRDDDRPGTRIDCRFPMTLVTSTEPGPSHRARS
jgi:PAS domain S-box-containing protein